MQYYIFDEVSPNRDASYLHLPDEIDLIDSIMGKKPNFEELPIKIEAEINEELKDNLSKIEFKGVSFKHTKEYNRRV